MERKYINRDRQEFQAADTNNMQEFTDQSLQTIVTNGLAKTDKIVGLGVTEKTITEITVAPGKLIKGAVGKVYKLDSAQDMSVFSYLPVQNKKYLALSAVGVEEQTDTQARDFLIDLVTGQTQPQSVAMETARNITLVINAGIESAEPQKPTAPTGYTVFKYIKLNSSGIEEIEDVPNIELPNLSEVADEVALLSAWQTAKEPVISTLATDVASLANKLAAVKDHNAAVRELAGDVARLKELANLPDSFSSYGSDYFLTEDESDTEDPAYNAKVDEGVRFPMVASDSKALALFNPYEAQVKQCENGLVLPTYQHNLRVALANYGGTLSISQYQSQSFSFRMPTLARERMKFGPIRDVASCNQRLRTGEVDHILLHLIKTGESYEALTGDPDNSHFERHSKLWRDKIIPPYFYNIPVTSTISGSQIAQTFLSSQHGWLSKIGLYFTKRDTNGSVYIHICETENGVPRLNRCLASVSLSPSLLNLYPTETAFELPDPVFLKAGTRYALVITTTGDHQVAIVAGSAYLAGTLFYCTDGDYYSGDLTKDLMLNLYFAKFNATYAQVNLEPLSLAGGIADIDLLASMFKPDATELFLEYQIAGKWYPLNTANAANLVALPTLLPIRLTFVGSEDVMPALELDTSLITFARPNASFKHISTVRTLGSAKADIEVILLLENWDAGDHGCTIKLLNGVTEETATSVTDETVSATSIRRTAHFDLDPAISSYQVIIEGTTADAANCFVVSERIDVAL